MHSYFVFMPEGEKAVKQHFPTAHYRLTDGLWAVGSPLETCVDVCNALGVDESKTMVVVPMDEYYGRYDRALWQKLESWSKT